MKNRLRLAAVIAIAALVFPAAALAAEEKANSAPIAENLEITTYRGVSVGGQLKAVDPDGEDVVFEITTPPTKGEIELGDNGSFVYTPDKGRRGRDYFGYRAIDTDGNCSQEATVIIRIQKQKTSVCYSDLDGRAEGYAAAFLAESGVFVGEKLGDSYVFSPEAELTRGEFLAMCMNAAGIAPASGAVTTGFYDDADTGAWAKPYISTALMRGIAAGMENADGLAVFEPNAPVTAAQAAVMLDRCFALTDTVSVWAAESGAVPAWAYQSAVNLNGCGLLPEGVSLSDETVTRAECAQMLTRAMELAARR